MKTVSAYTTSLTTYTFHIVTITASLMMNSGYGSKTAIKPIEWSLQRSPWSLPPALQYSSCRSQCSPPLRYALFNFNLHIFTAKCQFLSALHILDLMYRYHWDYIRWLWTTSIYENMLNCLHGPVCHQLCQTHQLQGDRPGDDEGAYAAYDGNEGQKSH